MRDSRLPKRQSRRGERLYGLLAALVLTMWPGSLPAQTEGGALLISLDADSTLVNDVLDVLAARSGLNIVTSPEVQRRKISIRIQNTPFDEALNLVVRAAGLGYERVGNSILVAGPERLQTRTGLTTRVFRLEYADPRRVADALAVLSQSVTVDAVNNCVIVRESQSLVEQAAAIIAELDKKPGQVLLQARLLELNDDAMVELGIDWEKITKWSTVLTEGDPGASRPGELPTSLEYLEFDDNEDIFRQVAAFEIGIDALLTDGKAKLLSDSKVATLDNQPAEIFVGETVPVIISSLGSTGGSGGGTFQTVELEKIDVGIKLSITPRISKDGFITATVEPEVSTITAYVGPDDDLPQTATRRASTTVRVRDGQKIYLGGLLSESETTTLKRVPLLGHIPILGRLFSHEKTVKEQTDLLIEITPKTMSDEGTPAEGGSSGK